MDIFRQNLFMSDKMAAGSLRFVFSKLSTLSVKRVYFLSTVVLSQILGLRLWVDLEALSTAPESPTGFWPVGCADWLGLYCLPLSTVAGWGMEVGSVLLNHVD